MGVRVGVIFFIVLLGFSMYSIPAYAEIEPPKKPLPHGKSAYLFKVAGFGGATWGTDIDNFVTNNNGYVHWAQWNFINQGFTDAGDTTSGGNCLTNGKTSPPFVTLPPPPVRNWDLAINQFRAAFHNSEFPELGPGHPSKLLMMGFSFGGAQTLFTVEHNPDITFDFVYTADPVGPNGNRINILHDVGIHHTTHPCLTIFDPPGGFPCVTYVPFFIDGNIAYEKCKDAGKKRTVPSNVKFYMNRWQEGKDSNGAQLFDTFLRVPPADNTRAATISGSFSSNAGFTNQGIYHCEVDGTGCHSQVANSAKTQNAVISALKLLNIPPTFTTDDEIFANEGSNVVFEVQAKDTATRGEETNEMDFRFRISPTPNGGGTTPDSKTKVVFSVPNPPCTFIVQKIQYCDPMIRTVVTTAKLSLGNIDGPSSIIKEIQVEDNGFPCGDCTAAGMDIATNGALGLWENKIFTINIINVPPTVFGSGTFQGFDLNLALLTHDPSPQDVQAGFDYEIDWGDGTIDNFHDDDNLSLTHFYLSGEYQITVTATDKDGGISQPITTTIQTPFHNFSDNIDDLINDGTLNKGQGNSFNSKISQVISSFEKTNNIPACNKAEAFINEVNGFVNGGMFTAEQGQDLIDKAQTEIDKAGCNSENSFSFELESDAEPNIDDNLPTTNNGRNRSIDVTDNLSNKIRLHNVNTDLSDSSNAQTSDIVTDDETGGGGDEHLTRPTFGLSHETFETIVDSGFRFNDQSFTINDNFHTPFSQQTVNIGEVNTFEAKIYADKRLKVQEFLFGIPNVGEAHLAELGVEIWYDYNGEIEEVKAVQKSNVIDKETLVATHEKTKCQALDFEEKCDVTNVSVVFLEPLKDKVMAVKAIDYKGRYQITYLNEGVDISGESLNPMQTYLIPSNIRDGGLIKVTQLAKYSPYWQSDDGRTFEMNSFGSFKEINITFERFQDTGNPYTRVHSGFGGIIAYELKRALNVFDASELISELPDYVPYSPPKISDRMNDEMKAKMLEQEEIAKKILEESKVQTRW